jgi:hypothetical protein
VRGEHDGVVPAQALDQLAGLDDLFGVEAGRGLVQDQDVRVVEDGLGQPHALPVALRQLPGFFGEVTSRIPLKGLKAKLDRAIEGKIGLGFEERVA